MDTTPVADDQIPIDSPHDADRDVAMHRKTPSPAPSQVSPDTQAHPPEQSANPSPSNRQDDAKSNSSEEKQLYASREIAPVNLTRPEHMDSRLARSPLPYEPPTYRPEPLKRTSSSFLLNVASTSYLDPPSKAPMMERPLNVTDALSYLDDVKLQFQDQPDVYNHFLDIMKDFKSQLIDTPGVIKRVSYLFNGRPSLIQGFNAFLPIGYHIECSTDPHDTNLITVTTPTGTMKQTTNNGPGPDLMWSTSDTLRPSEIFTGLGDNDDGGRLRLPMSPGPNFHMLDPQSIEPAIQYVRKIKERCEPDTYKQFLAILSRYHSKLDPVDEAEVSAQISELFKDTPELRSDFRIFMPDKSQQFFVDLEGNVYPPLAADSRNRIGTPLAIDGKSVRRRPDPVQSSPDGGAHSNLPLKRKRRIPDESRDRDGSVIVSSTSRVAQSSSKKTKSHQNIGLDMSSNAHAHSKYHSGPSDSHRPGHHGHRIHSHAPSSSRLPINTAANDPNHFFDRVKRALDNQEAYNEFLKVVNLFTQDYIDMATLVKQSRSFLPDGELLHQFKEILGWDEKKERESWLQEQQQGDSNRPPPRAVLEKRSRADMSVKYGSYRKLPASEGEVTCSGRDEMCRSVLNDGWVSHPSWSSEDSGFIAHKKNVYEEALHRSEEERHEYDFHIEAIVRTITMLEPINNKIMLLSPDERGNFKLKPNLGGSAKSIHQRVVKKIYGREAGLDVIQAMQDSPALAIPVVLARLKQKEEEWKRAQREWNRVWREVDARNYQRSLDHQAITFKAADKKAITMKAFVSQIEVAREEQMARRASLIDPLFARTRPRHQLQFVIDDEAVFQDALKLSFSFLDRTQAQLSFSERRRIECFMRSFVQLFFMLDPVAFDMSFAVMQDAVESEMSEDAESVADDVEVSSVASSVASSSAKPGRGHRKAGASSSGGDLRKKLLKSEQAKSTSRKTRAQEAASPSVSARQSPAVSDAMDVDSGDDGRRHSSQAGPARQAPRKNLFFCNSTYYTLLRLLEILYLRLVLFKDIGTRLAAKSRQPKTSTTDSGQPTDSADKSAGPHHFYELLLESCERLFDNEIEQSSFEDQMRHVFGTKDAYKIFTVDKLIGAIIKQVQSILTDVKGQELFEFLKRDRSIANPTSQDQINNRRNAEKTIGPDENLFRIDWLVESKTMLIQLIGKDDVTVNDSEFLTGRWQAYIDSFVSSENTQFVPTSKVKRPFLRKNVSPALDGGGHPRVIGWSGLEIKVCVRTYRLFFVDDTEEYLLRLSSGRETEKASERVRTRTLERKQWMEKVNAGLPSSGLSRLLST